MLVAGGRGQVDLAFVPGATPRSGRDLTHLHLTSAGPDDQDRLVAEVLRLGGRPLDVGQRPEEGHVVLADPEGNELCVIAPGNRWLAGCGLLSEVACTGSRAVGLFWSRALGWPLVWDSDGETAVQPSEGGTKIAWDGTPAPGGGRGRQRLQVVAPDGVPAEVDRLVALGATLLGRTADGSAELADPDGTPLSVTGRPGRGGHGTP